MIPILLEDMPLQDLPRDMQMYLRTYTYIDARGFDVETLRKRIRFAMPDTPLKNLIGYNSHVCQGKSDQMLEKIELENIEDTQMSNVESAEAIGGILRLLQSDGSILEVEYPAQLQCDSDESETSDEMVEIV